jgi:hypothetical protein
MGRACEQHSSLKLKSEQKKNNLARAPYSFLPQGQARQGEVARRPGAEMEGVSPTAPVIPDGLRADPDPGRTQSLNPWVPALRFAWPG